MALIVYPTRGSLPETGEIQLFDEVPSGNLVGILPQTGWSDYSVENATGYKTDSFWKKQASGVLLAPTSWVRTHNVCTGSHTSFNTVTRDGVSHRQRGSGPYRLRSQYVPFTGVLPNHRAYLEQQALAALYGQGMDLLTFVRELPQTFNMVLKALKRIRALIEVEHLKKNLWDQLKGRSYQDVKLILARKGGRDTKSIANAWLEYFYGWRLLYYDIIDIVKLFNNAPAFKYARGRAEKVTMITEIDDVVSTPYGMYDMRRIQNRNMRVSERVVVYSTLVPPRFRVDPIGSAWELTKLSFVFDWFMDIGAWYLSLKTVALSPELAASYSTLVEDDVVDHWYLQENPARPWTGFYDETAYYRHSSQARIPFAPSANLPMVQVSLDFGRILDLLALITQRVRLR